MDYADIRGIRAPGASEPPRLEDLVTTDPLAKNFLAILKARKKIYFSLGRDEIWVIEDLEKAIKGEGDGAVIGFGREEFFRGVGLFAPTSMEVLIIYAKMGVEVVLYGDGAWDIKTQEGFDSIEASVKNAVPTAVLTWRPDLG